MSSWSRKLLLLRTPTHLSADCDVPLVTQRIAHSALTSIVYGAVGEVPGKLKADVFQKSSASSSHALHSRFAFQLLNFQLCPPILLLSISSATAGFVCRYLAGRGVLDETIGLSGKQMATAGLCDPNPGRRLPGFQRPAVSDSLDLALFPMLMRLATLAPNAKHIIATKSGTIFKFRNRNW